MTDSPAVPLARLMGMGFRMLIDDLHARLIAEGWRDVRPAYGFVLLAIRDAETTTTDLARLLGVTKQATSKMLDAMERRRFVRRRASSDDARIKEVALAPRGQALLVAVEAIYADLEAEWADVIGTTAVARHARASSVCSAPATTGSCHSCGRPDGRPDASPRRAAH